MCNFLTYFGMLVVSTKSIGNTRQGLNALQPQSVPADGMWGVSYTLTVQLCGHDMKNPDSIWQQLPTILAGLNRNCCGVWSLDRLCGWLETKKLKSSPAVQQETLCWKCHRPIVHNHISHRWPRNLSSAISLQKILPFPRP